MEEEGIKLCLKSIASPKFSNKEKEGMKEAHAGAKAAEQAQDSDLRCIEAGPPAEGASCAHRASPR